MPAATGAKMPDGTLLDSGTCGGCAALTGGPQSSIRRCRNPRAPRFWLCCANDTPACALYSRATVAVDKQQERAARARFELDQAKICLRCARREQDAERPQRWLINDYLRHAVRHAQNYRLYRALEIGAR